MHGKYVSLKGVRIEKAVYELKSALKLNTIYLKPFLRRVLRNILLSNLVPHDHFRHTTVEIIGQHS